MSDGLSVQQMQTADRLASEKFGIPSLILMENAGRGVAEIITREFPDSQVLVICGKGNNGGDGFVIARHLSTSGHGVRVLLAANPGSLKADAALNWVRLQSLKIPVRSWPLENAEEAAAFGNEADLIVDAVFGIGLTRPVQEPFLSLIRFINRSQKKIVSVDVPSGLDADRGKVLGEAVRATITATLGRVKSGLLDGEGPACAGRVLTVDIGIPDAAYAEAQESSDEK
jgi:NAD(P)H-hydrate epimerase